MRTPAPALNRLVLFVYPVPLIRLNRGMLPAIIELKGIRYAALLRAALFYGGLSIYLLIDPFGKLF